jgi:hypothetical protein
VARPEMKAQRVLKSTHGNAWQDAIAGSDAT